jgi:hypothetical protein
MIGWYLVLAGLVLATGVFFMVRYQLSLTQGNMMAFIMHGYGMHIAYLVCRNLIVGGRMFSFASICKGVVKLCCPEDVAYGKECVVTLSTRPHTGSVKFKVTTGASSYNKYVVSNDKLPLGRVAVLDEHLAALRVLYGTKSIQGKEFYLSVKPV